MRCTVSRSSDLHSVGVGCRWRPLRAPMAKACTSAARHGHLRGLALPYDLHFAWWQRSGRGTYSASPPAMAREDSEVPLAYGIIRRRYTPAATAIWHLYPASSHMTGVLIARDGVRRAQLPPRWVQSVASAGGCVTPAFGGSCLLPDLGQADRPDRPRDRLMSGAGSAGARARRRAWRAIGQAASPAKRQHSAVHGCPTPAHACNCRAGCDGSASRDQWRLTSDRAKGHRSRLRTEQVDRHIIRALVGLRVSEEEEHEGLDLALHSEQML